MRFGLTFCLAVTVGWLAAFGALASTLSIGTLNEAGIRKQVRYYEPLTNYLEKHLRHAGVSDVRLVVYSTTRLMADAMSRGDVDILIDSPMVAAKVSKMSGATPFLRRWKNGISSYYSVIITAVDSDIKSIDDLGGHTIAFEEPDSTSGFMLPAHMLLQRDLKIRELRNHRIKPSATEVGYILTYNDNNSLFALASGRVDAAATNQEAFTHLQAARPGEFHVIASSDPVPRNVLLHRPGMDPDLLVALKEVLTTMFRTKEGRQVLKEFQNTAGFDEFPNGSKAAFAPIFRILQDLEDAGYN